MASSKIKGITIEIDGNTSKLNDALRTTEQELNKTEKELKDVNNALKFDPKNTELLAQKQKLLGDAIKDTTKKLGTLKKAKEQAEAKGVGKESEDYRALEREISRTTQSLKGLQTQQENVNDAFKDGSNSTSSFKDTLKALLTANWIQAGLNIVKGAITSIIDLTKSAINGLFELTKQGVLYNAQMDTYATNIKALLKGDVEQTDRLLKSMKKISNLSGFSSSSLIGSLKSLLTTGDSVDNVNALVEALAKVSEYAGLSDSDVELLAINLQGIKSNAKATSADLKQFTNRGIAINDILAKSLGITTEKVGDLTITYEMLRDALIKVGEEDEIISKIFDTNANTFQTQTNLIKSNWNELLGNITGDTYNAINNDILPTISTMLQAMNGAFENGTGYEGMSDAFGENIGQVIQSILDSGIIDSFINIGIAFIDALGEAFNPETEQGRENCEKLEALFDKLTTSLVGLFTKTNILKKFNEIGMRLGQAIGSGIKSGIYASIGEGMAIRWADYLDENGNLKGSGGFGNSGGFGALQSGGYGSITLNASFVANGNLDEAQALRFADLMTERINEKLGMGV